jgi:transcriptional regulator with XRE-family HTH domain
MNPAGRREAGATIRSARQAASLTLADLGRRTGYSPSQVSRYERGIAPLTDTTVLRRFADALALPPQTFGLLPTEQAGRPEPVGASSVTAGAGAPRVGRKPQWEDGEDPVRRRELLTGAAGLAAAGALGLPTAARAAARKTDPAAELEALLYRHSPVVAEPVPLTALRTVTSRARGLFQAARYDQLSAELPRLITPTVANASPRTHSSPTPTSSPPASWSS